LSPVDLKSKNGKPEHKLITHQGSKEIVAWTGWGYIWDTAAKI
jgi:hypothetical protein